MKHWPIVPSTKVGEYLLESCLEAHSISARRENVSSCVLIYAATANGGDYFKSLVAALSTLGGKHAPLSETYKVLTDSHEAGRLLDAGLPVPGWGSSFGAKPDPTWEPVRILLQAHFPAVHARIVMISGMLAARGKHIFPNPSCYTAATGIALSIPPEILGWLFIQGRLEAWTQIFLDTTQNQNPNT